MAESAVASATNGSRLWPAARSVLHALPRGGLLPQTNWRRRHAALTFVLMVHAPALLVYGLARGNPLWHAALDAAVPAVLAVASMPVRLGRTLRSLLVATGLILCSVIVVHLSGGLIEAHFHFFVMVSLLTLYQDWRPFLLAITMVVVEHGLTGVLSPESVYNHAGAWEHPWRWALLHGAYVLAASAANITAWSFTESDHRRLEEQMHRLHSEREAMLRLESHHDPLTGLPNRRMVLDHLESAAARCRSTDRLLGLLFIDLDGFKQINDTYGHVVGDMVLSETADRLRTAVRGSDIPARLGGDEFVIVCEDLSDETGLEVAAARVEAALSQPVRIDGEICVTVAASIGRVVGAPDDAAAELIERADLDMYRVKHLRKGELRISAARPLLAEPRRGD